MSSARFTFLSAVRLAHQLLASQSSLVRAWDCSACRSHKMINSMVSVFEKSKLAKWVVFPFLQSFDFPGVALENHPAQTIEAMVDDRQSELEGFESQPYHGC